MMILKWVLPAIQLRVSLSFTLNLPHLFSASDSELERERERLRVQIGERESLSFYNLFKFEVKSTLQYQIRIRYVDSLSSSSNPLLHGKSWKFGGLFILELSTDTAAYHPLCRKKCQDYNRVLKLLHFFCFWLVTGRL